MVTPRSRFSAPARPRAVRAGRRRTSRRTTARSRSGSASSIGSSSTPKRARTATTGPRPPSRPTTSTRRSAGPTPDRGRSYDYEGFNRQPTIDGRELPAGLQLPASAEQLAAFMRRFVPYLNGWRDAAEPDSLYLWDAAARAGLSYRTYGEFVGTLSADDVAAFNRRKPKSYPDVSATVATVPAKQALEANHNAQFRAFDLWTPDAMTAASYAATHLSSTRVDPLVSTRSRRPALPRHVASSARGWMSSGRHVGGSRGRSRAITSRRSRSCTCRTTTRSASRPVCPRRSSTWPTTTTRSDGWSKPSHTARTGRTRPILVVEDDAQDGPDHVDAHRSPVLVISAYSRRGALVHELHNTVSLIRTMELLLGIPPMNQLDAAAIPMDVFQDTADLEPYTARAARGRARQPGLRAADAARASGTGSARPRRMALTTPDAANPRPAERGHLVLGPR